MRVISGTARGRSLKPVPGMGTRPTTDKVKEALFSMIGPYFDGGRALDLFAGTGGLGIEAVSRGAEMAIFVDKDPKAVEVVQHNVESAGMKEQCEVYRNDARRAIKALTKRGMQFQLIFLDPPYRLKDADELLMSMWNGGLIGRDATIVVEHDARHQYPSSIGPLYVWKLADYGEIALTMYKVSDEIPNAPQAPPRIKEQ
ncbi:16S rRNA (guanine(966)-N(2))-methyltransferase RsmD [Paenibacillus apiarius]|uniref:16S rRNA (guanine(966)-N(2))-methyltransferase RsmD n=1 Tax=Paenibacillus apiarius TaxID=46240 RepID=UPI00197D4B35|nr:16S rRNA (guanine(966)-N(2))-methyltransferase RsmD [Paenibacillus apiarius]MBN3526127.1 16S rRNA (guanine(966)-N(2))-methyltransferase RsmD [Paenibacillus apiarius]